MLVLVLALVLLVLVLLLLLLFVLLVSVLCVSVLLVLVLVGVVFFLYERPLFSRTCARSGGGVRLLCRPQRSRHLRRQSAPECSKTIRRGGIGEMNNSEERGRWVDGRERSRVKDSVSLWQGGGREDASETLVLTVL